MSFTCPCVYVFMIAYTQCLWLHIRSVYDYIYAGHSVWHLVCLAGSSVCSNSVLSLSPMTRKSCLCLPSLNWIFNLFYIFDLTDFLLFIMCVFVLLCFWIYCVNFDLVFAEFCSRQAAGDSFLFLPWLPRSCYSFYSLSRSQIALHATFTQCYKYSTGMCAIIKAQFSGMFYTARLVFNTAPAVRLSHIIVWT